VKTCDHIAMDVMKMLAELREELDYAFKLPATDEGH
jgi:hypothetical protein